MSSGVLVVSSSEAFTDMLSEASTQLIVGDRTPEAFAAQIKKVMWMPPDERLHIGERLRRIVERDHSLPILITNLMRRMQ